MNPIVEGWPSEIDVEGHAYRFETGFRRWLMLYAATGDRTLSQPEAMAAIYELSGIEPTDDPSRDIRAVGEFANGRGRRGHGKRVLDYEHDADLIIASFQSFYGIDLTDPATDMHWWRFLALMRGLGEDTAIIRTVRLRTAEPPEGNSPDARRRRDALRRAQRDVALPPRTYAEAVERDRAIWGD